MEKIDQKHLETLSGATILGHVIIEGRQGLFLQDMGAALKEDLSLMVG